MNTTKLEKRLSAVEREIEHLKAQIAAAPPRKENWAESIAGTFANDPLFDDAMRLGRKWRESQRPKIRTPKSHKSQSTPRKAAK